MTTSSAAGRAPTNVVGEFTAEFQAPLPDRLLGDSDAMRSQHLLDHPQAQWEPEHSQTAKLMRSAGSR
jgi:hypothetical protein